MDIVLVYNPQSGSARAKSELNTLCLKYGIRVVKFIETDRLLKKHLAPYIHKNATIAAIGGDGTLSEVAGCLAGSKAVFVPLPGGTLNHFVKDLGITLDLEKALARLSHSRVTSVDVATLNGRVFINNSSIGLYPSSLSTRNQLESFLGKWFAAVIAAVRAFLYFRTYIVTVQNETFHTPFVFIGNNVYAIDKLGVAERHKVDEGALSVFIARTTSRGTLLKIALMTIIGKAKMMDEFETRIVPSLVIKTKSKHLRVACDGEIRTFKSPLRYETQPHQLKIRK